MYYNNNIPPFSYWIYNPQYINPNVYVQYQAKIQAYQQQQNFEVINAANKLQEYIDAVKKVDNNHQEDLFVACLAVIAKELNWRI